MAYKAEMLQQGLPFGRQIIGLQPADIRKKEVRQELCDYWLQDGLLVFRGSEVTHEFQIELSTVFGEIEIHPVPEVRVPGRPELMTIISDQNDAVYEIDGVRSVGFVPWHVDLMYTETVNRGGVLTATQLSSWGGNTGFIDRGDVYDSLDDELKEAIEDVEVVHQFCLNPGGSRFGMKEVVRTLRVAQMIKSLEPRLDTDYPPVVHPLVFIHPDTGRKILNVSPYGALYILGQNDPAGDALLERVIDHFVSRPAYYHSWKPSEMLLWDNWRMAHCVTAAAPDDVRTVERTTIKGEYGLGRRLDEEAAA